MFLLWRLCWGVSVCRECFSRLSAVSGVDSTSDVCRDERRVEVAGVDEEVVAAAGAGVAVGMD